MDPIVTSTTLDAGTLEAIGLDPDGPDGNPRVPYTGASLTDAELARLARYRATGLTYTVIDLDRVVTLLRERHGITDAYVEQTGGGCATIYAGKLAGHDPGHDPVWTVAAGPGWFGGPAWTKARATLDEFYIGVSGGDYAELGRATRDGDDENSVAATIAEAVTTRRAAIGALVTRIRAVPGYDPAAFLTDPDSVLRHAGDTAAPPDDLLTAAAIAVIRAEAGGGPAALAFDIAAASAAIVTAVAQDMADGVIPVTATTFRALHDAVDANDYLTAAGVPADPATVAQVQQHTEHRLAILSRNVRRLIRAAATITIEPQDVHTSAAPVPGGDQRAEAHASSYTPLALHARHSTGDAAEGDTGPRAVLTIGFGDAVLYLYESLHTRGVLVIDVAEAEPQPAGLRLVIGGSDAYSTGTETVAVSPPESQLTGVVLRVGGGDVPHLLAALDLAGALAGWAIYGQFSASSDRELGQLRRDALARIRAEARRG